MEKTKNHIRMAESMRGIIPVKLQGGMVFYLILVPFLILNAYLLLNEHYWSVIIPLIILTLFLLVYAFDKVLLLLVMFTPVSVYFLNQELNAGISIPVEPLMVGVLIIFFLKMLFGQEYDKNILRHPVSICIMIYLFWMLVTTISSDLPIVSIKYFLSRLWFIIPMYFVITILFKNPANIKRYFWYYAIPLILVIIYTTYRHYLNGFEEKTCRWVMKPFYNDHTAYGAVMSMFIPVFIGFSFHSENKTPVRIISAIFSLFMLTALFLSFSRAAWLSILISVSVFSIILLKIKFRWILLVVVLISAVFYSFRFEILKSLEKNEHVTSADFSEHLRSITNISSDASNLERLNRWQSAFRMFREKPLLGFGPGTYQFLYAPYQSAKEKTVISTNYGNIGNAHSEYIGPLCESGLPGMLIFILLAIMIIYTGVKVHMQAQSKEIKVISLCVLLGLITYLSHGLLNNFLHTTKLSVPFWGFTAALVAMDLFHKNKRTVNENEVRSDTSA